MPDNLALRLRSGTATAADVEYAARCVDAFEKLEWLRPKRCWRLEVSSGAWLDNGLLDGHATALEAIEEAVDE